MIKNSTDPSQIFLDSIAGHSVTSAELLEMMQTGCSLAEARERSRERARIREAADKIEGKPLEMWPTFDVRWDLDPANFYRAFDGADPTSIDKNELVPIQDVPLANVDVALTPYWHRTAEEAWSVGSPDKAARVIIHWEEGGLMTPPLLVPVNDGQLSIAGGNHRLAVARTKGVTRLPVLSKVADEARVRRILRVQ
jgi:hypothetical protein